MRTSGALALGAVFLVAAWIRLSPLLTFLYWGADFGEYYGILRDLVASGRVSTTYTGWGITYPYFPGMFFAQGALPALAPVDVPSVAAVLVPVLGALVILPAFLIGAGIAREAKVGLFVAAFVAVAMPHVYATAHAAPVTLGDLLAFSSLLAFLRLRRDPRMAVPLALFIPALVVTHHLSTYFLILMVFGAIVLRGLLRPARSGPETRREVLAVGFLLAATFAFWFGYARTFRDGIIRDVNVQPWWLLLAAFPVFLALLAGLVVLRRRLPWRYRPRAPGFRGSLGRYGLALGFAIGLAGSAVVVPVPGTQIRLAPAVLYQFLPFYAVLALSAAGRRHADFLADGVAPSAWFLALVLSAGVGALAAPRVIVPYRHVEYMILPLGLLAAVGFARLLDLAGLRAGGRAAAVAFAGLLFLGNAATAIPPPDLFASWQEGIRPAAVDAAYWSRAHALGLIATDHRASTVLFGFGGANGTWDTARAPFLAESFADARDGFLAVPSPSGEKDVTFVWIDQDTMSGAQLFPWEPAVPMTPGAIGKFSDSPFVKMYDNGYGELYWIAWGCDVGTC